MSDEQVPTPERLDELEMRIFKMETLFQMKQQTDAAIVLAIKSLENRMERVERRLAEVERATPLRAAPSKPLPKQWRWKMP